jgi:hypothetical protein
VQVMQGLKGDERVALKDPTDTGNKQ